MSCERLICAQCAGPVAEGRCVSCRAARADLHTHGLGTSAYTAVVIGLVLVALLAVLLQTH